MNKLKTFFDVFAALVLLGHIAYFFTPTTIFFNPVALEYRKEADGKWYGYFHRETPLGTVRASFTQTMRPARGVSEHSPPAPCVHQRAEPIPFDPKHEFTVFEAPASVVRCLEAPRPTVDTTTFTVRLGWISLRPVVLEVIHN